MSNASMDKIFKMGSSEMKNQNDSATATVSSEYPINVTNSALFSLVELAILSDPFQYFKCK